MYTLPFNFQLSADWTQLEVIDLINDGTGLGFGIIGGRSTGVVVKTILPGGIADIVSCLSFNPFILLFTEEIQLKNLIILIPLLGINRLVVGTGSPISPLT